MAPALPGPFLRSGRRGRRFKSYHPDQFPLRIYRLDARARLLFVGRLPAELISAELYALLAATQMQAGLFGEARRNVARGLELAPTNSELKALEESLRAPRDGELAL